MAEKIEQIIGKMKKGEKKTIIYEMMWTESTFNFGEVLPTNDDVSSKKEEPSSCRFSNDDCFENAYKKAIETSKELASIGKRGKQLSDDDKKKYNKLKDNYKGLIKPNYDSEVKKLFIKRFGIKNETDFKDKYDMAVSGSGNESFKITTLHSSSLCCLLFFYNVSKNNPLTLKFETNKGERRVTFTESVFEFKNKVISSPSNIDVVLIGKDEDKKNTILLFLESKFAEYYLSSGKTCDLGEGYLKNKIGAKLYKIKHDLNNDLGSMDYGKPYYLEGLKCLGVTIEKNKQKKNGKDKDVYKIQSNKISYIDGIKQMISHYIGIKNLMDGKYHSSKGKQQQIIKEIIKNKDDIIFILGEIAFELPNEAAMTALNNYRENYELLAEIIAEQEPANSRFEILKDLRFYSEITEDERTKGEKNNYKVDEKVKAFYRMN